MSDDPVRARRASIARWTAVAERLGYLAFGVAVAAFLVALLTDLSRPSVALVTAGLVVGSILLAPAIVLRYAVRAAEREDRERGM